MRDLNPRVNLEIEVSEALMQRLQALAGCSSARRVEAVASWLLSQALESQRLP